MARGVRDVRLFEIGTAFAPGTGAAPRESSRVAVVLAGRREPPHWSGPDAPFDVYDIARVLGLVAAEAHPGWRVEPAGTGVAPAPYLAGRCHRLVNGAEEVVGWGGEVDPSAVDLPPWAGVVVGAEVVLPARPPARPAVTARDLPDQPASQRDPCVSGAARGRGRGCASRCSQGCRRTA